MASAETRDEASHKTTCCRAAEGGEARVWENSAAQEAPRGVFGGGPCCGVLPPTPKRRRVHLCWVGKRVVPEVLVHIVSSRFWPKRTEWSEDQANEQT